MTDLKLNIKKVQAVPLDEYYTAYQLQQLINFYKTITPKNDKVGVSFIKELEKHSESFIKKLDGAQSVIKHGTSKIKMKEKKPIQM